VLLVQLEVPISAVRQAIQLAHDAGVPVILNPAPAQVMDRDLLQMVTVATPNEHEIRTVVGLQEQDAAISAMLEAGTDTVLVTLGKRGVVWATGQAQRTIPAFEVEAVDTTAAGDAFNGGLACALGKGAAMPDAIQYANAVAALSVTRMGAQPSLPTTAQVDAFLASASTALAP
jgi:ribokinase